ncbi:MAG: acyl--CoA ligase, partial [Sinobacteraceae bacterium]|nr:acyl--CoA ligase [Nevskiaceae bacterium]
GRGEQVAIIHHESSTALTYRDLSEQSARFANVLVAMGVQPGDRVAYRIPNRPEALIVIIATWKVGAVVVPLPMQSRAGELAFLIEDTQPRVLVAWLDERSREDIRSALWTASAGATRVIGIDDWSDMLIRASSVFAAPTLSSDGLAVLWHTGGTTGQPKACYHTHRRFLLAGYSIGQATQVQVGQRWAAAAPLGHALGFIVHTNYTLLHGATIVLIEGYNRPEIVLTALARHRVHTFTAITATWGRLHEALLAEPEHDLRCLQRGFAMWQSASALEIQHAWRDRGLILQNNFGSTAFAAWVLVPPAGVSVPAASLGRPAPGYEVNVIEPEVRAVRPMFAGSIGRMAVRGPSGLTYWNRPEIQERDIVDGWTLVDDLIQFDTEGNASYLGRTDFLISTAGNKVAPVEVEAVLGLHPAVREVAVLGAPDPIRQEVVAAFIAVHAGIRSDEALRVELQEFVRQRLSPYKAPRRIEFIEALPRDHVGKVQSRVLKNRLAAKDTV